MNLRVIAGVVFAVMCWAAPDPVAARLAHDARQAQDSGHVVRAYLLYAEAAAREPHNPTYSANRDALAAAAKLLTKADVETAHDADISRDIKTAESQGAESQGAENQGANPEPPVEFATKREWERDENLQPLPDLRPKASLATFELRGDEKQLLEQVAGTYGIRTIFDPQLDVHTGIRFSITQADFQTAMEGLTAVTNTFVFPISQHEIFLARDTELKRAEFEPNILLTFQLPNALDQRDLIEAASAVRAVLSLRAIGWDSENRTVMIRDRYTRARAARSLMEAVLLPRAQLSIEVQFLTFDSDRSYHYGVSLPTAFQLVDFGLANFRNVLPNVTNAPNFLAFGGGATLLGFGLTSATVFANYSNSFSRILYDATVVVAEGQTASLHIGDQYPIAQSIYTGFQQSAASIYNPAPQITMEDLGIILKMSPRVNGDGDISLELEADYKSLGSQTFNTVPAIAERQFKGSISLREGQWAVVAGMDSSNRTITRNGLSGISQIAGLNQVFSENTRETQVSNTLILLKPTITRLPMSAAISPQYLLGPIHGERVLH